MSQFREHRGALTDSIATLVEVTDRAALIEHCRKLLTSYGEASLNLPYEKIEVKPYVLGPDPRIGWAATYIVMLPGYGVVGFTDAPL